MATIRVLIVQVRPMLETDHAGGPKPDLLPPEQYETADAKNLDLAVRSIEARVHANCYMRMGTVQRGDNPRIEFDQGTSLTIKKITAIIDDAVRWANDYHMTKGQK